MTLPGTEKKQGNAYWWNIIGGKFARRVKDGDSNARMRKNKEGKEVWEEYSDSLTGSIKSVSLQSGEYGEQLVVTLIPAPGFTYYIQIGRQTRFANCFLERLPQLRTGMSVKIIPYSFEDDNQKKVSGLNIFSGTNFEKKHESSFRVKKDGKIEYLSGFPKFPENWNTLKESQKKIYFVQVEEFLNEQLDKWRLENNFVEKEHDETPVQTNEDDDLPF